MNLTIGFIILFLILFLPGIIFRRFYYLGEFSKQIIPDENILKTLTFAIIPSAIIQLIGLIVFDKFFNPIDVSDLYKILKELFNQELLTSENQLNKNDLENFIIYQTTIYAASIILAVTAYLTVRGLNLDRRFKLLRFKNQWAYVFSAEILSFEKFKGGNIASKNKFLFPYVDIMVRKNENETELYSGFITDYDLNPKNINEIDRLYLTEAKRFKKTGTEYVSKVIPGDFLILLGKEILNINVNYVVNEKKKKAKQKIIQRILYVINVLYLFFVFGSFPLLAFNLNFNLNFLSFYNEINWIGRLVIWAGINQSYAIFFPFTISKETNQYVFVGWKQYKQVLKISVIILAVLSGLLYLLL